MASSQRATQNSNTKGSDKRQTRANTEVCTRAEHRGRHQRAWHTNCLKPSKPEFWLHRSPTSPAIHCCCDAHNLRLFALQNWLTDSLNNCRFEVCPKICKKRTQTPKIENTTSQNVSVVRIKKNSERKSKNYQMRKAQTNWQRQTKKVSK